MTSAPAQRIERLVQEWRLEGEKKGEIAVLRRLLERRFGALPADAIERLENADVDLLLEWSDRVLTATRLDEVFE